MATDALSTQKCPHCHSKTLVLDKKCTECGFPVEGSKSQQDTFLSKIKKARKRVQEVQSFVKWAISLLYFIGMLYIFIFLRLQVPWGAKWAGVMLGMPYITLGIIASRYKPRIIFMVALAFYLFTEIVLLQYLHLPVSLFNQLWAKITVASILIIGSIAAYYSDKLKQKAKIS
ncbi:hypothetical protein [uncultured Microscilla sp.]|uniref:hypothetical protein n=1 Tax=uncultured Microscilla sp. TaxID=432653 RepID=UPI0026353758|nr:hypothetical protein [uncultured Microscilla sp.]